MIDFYYWTTPNGHKITIFLEEAGLEYRLIPVDLSKGDQFKEEFLAISPTHRIPAIVDQTPVQSDVPISVFESGAILLYLAEKTGRFIPADIPGRTETIQWLIWQVSGLGPILGQYHHFTQSAPQSIPYAIDRYATETKNLYTLLDTRLTDRSFIAGDYSITDMACYPWIVPHETMGQNLDDFPNIKRWFHTIRARPAVSRAYDKAKDIN